MKRRRLLSFALALVMCISMCMTGLTANAANPGDIPPMEPECTCEYKCTEGSIDPVCGVCSTDGADLSKCTGTEVVSEPECDCTIKCTVDSINGDCAVCGVAEADLTQCKGAEQTQAPVLLGDPKAEIDSYDSLTQAIEEAPDDQDTTIQLTDNITGFAQTIEIPENKVITLDLNGYTIACVSEAEISAITVEGTLTLIDTSTDGNGTISGGQGGGNGSEDKPNFGGSVYVSSDAIFNMKGGHISGNKSKGQNYSSDLIGGCGVYVHLDGTFNLSGGYIENNTLNISYYGFGGAGVLVQGGTFEMTGGTIRKNAIERLSSNGSYQNATGFGAGVLIKSVTIGGTKYSATFNMRGGEITNNRVNASTGAGAGVAVGYKYDEADSSTFTMTGGRISGNTIDAFGQDTRGGGVFCGGNMNISGSAVISENIATATNSNGYGGGVYCTPFAVLNMSGGKITQNTATSEKWSTSGYGGGIYIKDDNSSSTGEAEQYAFFTMTDGEITENSAGRSGGGVYFVSRAKGSPLFDEERKKFNFIISGGEITDNTAGKMAGGIYYDGDLFQRTGGKLCNNTAGNDGDDMIINTNAYPSCIELGEVGDDWTLDCDHSVDGWYIDGDAIHNTSDDRWNATVTDGTNTFYCRPESSTGYVEEFTGFAQYEAYAIKAAHGNLAVSYFPLTYDLANEGTTYPMTATSQSFKENTKVLLQLDGGTLASQTGGSHNSADNTWTITMSQAITVGHPTKDGYYFTGWQVVPGLDSSEYALVLAPRWISKSSLGTITVQFDLDGGKTGSGKDSFEIQVARPYTETSLRDIAEISEAMETPITKAEFIFDKWQQVTTGEGIYTQSSISIETPQDAVVIYRAIWKADIKYTINFDSQGGTPVTDKIEFYQSELDIGENQIALYKELQAFTRPASIRLGYKLDHWYFDLLEYYVDNNLIGEDNDIVVNAQSARTQAKQQYAAGQITEAQYWESMESAYYYNIDAWIDANEASLADALESLGLGSELGYGMGCYLPFNEIFENISSITLTAQWTPVITISPVNMTIYMGGNGYTGIVDEGGNIVTSGDGAYQNGFPTPGFTIDLPDSIEADFNIESLRLKYTGDPNASNPSEAQDYEWKFVPYDGVSSGIYRIEPAGNTQSRPVRMLFTNGEEVVISDSEFEPGLNLNQTLTMKVYGEGIEEDKVYFEYNGTRFDIAVVDASLTVRGTTEDVQYAQISTPELLEQDKSQPMVTAPTGTVFTLGDAPSNSIANANNTNSFSSNPPAISLLFDEIINSNAANNDRTNLLQQRTDAVLGQTNNNRHYDFKYLDLVDTNNGNVWVKASNNVTVYWPLPEGTNANTHFELLHFADAHRSLSNTDIQTAIQSGKVETMRIQQVTDTHVVFEVGSGGFSPFALVWETKSGGTVDPGPGPDPTPTEHTLRYDTNGGEKLQSETKKVSWTKEYEDLPIPERDGYTFAGWYRNSTLTMPITGDVKVYGTVTIYAKWNKTVTDPDETGVSDLLNTQEHRVYLHGYDTGLFGPNNDMTRAEAAQMFYNLLLDKDVPITVNFSDVPADAWYTTAVNTLASLGLVEGVGNNQFAPERAITRAEFTVIAMRFTNGEVSGENIFSDISANDWFYDQVVGSIQYGWITGYEDGTFRPNTTIARAEVTTIVNRMLGRSADVDYVDRHEDDLRLFPDVSQDYWAYYQIVEATNAHDYTKEGNTESWSKLK